MNYETKTTAIIIAGGKFMDMILQHFKTLFLNEKNADSFYSKPLHSFITLSTDMHCKKSWKRDHTVKNIKKDVLGWFIRITLF